MRGKYHPAMATILVIDDHDPVISALRMLFALDDIAVEGAHAPEEGLARLRRGGIDLVIADMNFGIDTTSGEDGARLFADIRALDPDLPVILLTAWTQLERAVELVRAGAADYLGKPWDDARLRTTVRNLLELGESRRALRTQASRARQRREDLSAAHDLCGTVFADPATERVLALACQVARSQLPVLVTGPNGSGKEKLAQIVHANSAVHDGPFVAVNCGALPAELVESELFGAEAGAYTGAQRARAGRFEAADGGTLFLDEIGTLPPAGQAKLLRVLETGRFTRLGGNREIAVQVRIISATNADLPAMVADGRFREDLYYRLNAVELRLPPLRERPDDIAALARHFLPATHLLDDGAMTALQAHPWPGNVRELRNTMQRAALLAEDGVVRRGHLGLADAPAPPAATVEPDAAQIEAALARHGGVIAQAAAELGLSRQALYRRMERHGLRH